MKTQKKLESIINTEGEKNGARRMRFPDFRLSYKAIVIKTVWYQHRNRNINQQNRKERSGGKKKTHSSMLNESMTKKTRILNGEKTVFSISNARKIGQLHVKVSNWKVF